MHYHHGDQLRDPLCSVDHLRKLILGTKGFTHVDMLHTLCDTSHIYLWGWASYMVSYKFLLSKNIREQSETRRVCSPRGPTGQKTTPTQAREETYWKQPSAPAPSLSSTVPKAEEDSGNANMLVL